MLCKNSVPAIALKCACASKWGNTPNTEYQYPALNFESGWLVQASGRHLQIKVPQIESNIGKIINDKFVLLHSNLD